MQIGVRDFKYAGKICHLRIGRVIWHMRSGCKSIVNGILWEMSELITQEWVSSFLTANQHIIGYSVPEMVDSKRTST